MSKASFLLIFLAVVAARMDRHELKHKLSEHIKSKEHLQTAVELCFEIETILGNANAFQLTLKKLLSISKYLEENLPQQSNVLALQVFKIALAVSKNSPHEIVALMDLLINSIKTVRRSAIKSFTEEFETIFDKSPDMGLFLLSKMGILIEQSRTLGKSDTSTFLLRLVTLTRIVIERNVVTENIAVIAIEITEQCVIVGNVILELLSKAVQCPAVNWDGIAAVLKTSKRLMAQKLDDILVEIVESLLRNVERSKKPCECFFDRGFEEFAQFFLTVSERRCEGLMIDFARTMAKLS